MKAVVTGCGKGIGREIVLELGKMGIDIVGCSRTEKDLLELQQEFGKLYPDRHMHYKVVDLAKKEEVMTFGRYLVDHHGAIDILVNNAGVFFPGELHTEEEGSLERMIDTNLYSAYHLCRALVPDMKARQGGQIINICSVASITALPNCGSYSISKFALYGMTKCLREELKDDGIRVHAILPGATWSHSWEGVDLPPDRLMAPTDIAKTVRVCIELSDNAVIEELIVRPLLGDL